MLLDYFEDDYTVKDAFEWCSGPGWIGFGLLDREIAEHVTFGDINPEAIECVGESIDLNGVENMCEAYVSPNFDNIPEYETFDLVVGNPPSYCNLNPEHPAYHLNSGDLRPNDPGWVAHIDFYHHLPDYLEDGGRCVILEAEPHKKEVVIPPFDIPYDQRPEKPIDIFRQLIKDAGLKYEGCSRVGSLLGVLDIYAIECRKD